VVSWNSISLAAGQAASQQVTVQAPLTAGSIVSASAQLIDDTTTLSYSRATADTLVASENALQIGVSATPDPVEPGQVVVYSIHVSNPTSNNTGGFTIRASVPNGVTVPQAQGYGAYCSGSWPCQPGEQLFWNWSLPPQQEGTLQFAAQVDSDPAPSNGTLLSSLITTNVGGSAVSSVVVGGGVPMLSLTAPEQISASST
jgi:hypothetical protein